MKNWTERLAALWAWLRETGTRLGKALEEKGRRLGGLLWERRERLAPPAAFLCISLALLMVGNLLLPSPAARVAGRYLDTAFAYDYDKLYSLFDQAVLERELARHSMDREDMAAVARENSRQVERYVEDIETGYGVDVSYTYRVAGERPLEPEELEALRERYAADRFQVELWEARRVSVWVVAQMAGEDHHADLLRELELTAICTPRGWFLDRESMHVFLNVIYDLPGFARENFGI